jgi:hypothetical protein
MKVRQASLMGVAVYAGLSVVVIASSMFVARHPWRASPASVDPLAEGVARHSPSPTPPALIAPQEEHHLIGAVLPDDADGVEALVDRLVALFTRDPTDVNEDEIARVEGALVARGEIAGALLAGRIDALRGAAASQRDRLLHVLRRLPGRTAEDRLIREARSGAADSSRALAIESLAERRQDMYSSSWA